MWHTPINGSQINIPAKLYKRFTPTETVTLDGTEIVYENNYYRSYASIPYIEATDKQQGDEQPLSGLVTGADYMTIKYNGTYKPRRGDLREPDHGDLLVIDKEMWVIEDTIQRVRVKSLVNFAVVYLPLRRLM